MAKSELKAELGVPDDCVPITASDTTTYSPPLRGLRANSAGVIKVDTYAGGPGSGRLMNFAAGETRYVKIIKVYATGTTVSDVIEALY